MSKTQKISRFARQLGLFRRDQRGNVAVIVGAAIIPLVGALGLATDTARGFLVKARLSQALDAAALAGGKVFFSETRDDDIKQFFAANFPSTTLPTFDTEYHAEFMDADVTLSAPEESSSNGDDNMDQLNMTAEATINTTFMRVLGFETVTVTAATQVTRAVKALDVVISMDLSGSMENPSTKITAARDAAVSFIDTVFAGRDEAQQLTIDGTTYDLLHIGFVPWNAKTRVTTQGATDTTVTTTGPVAGFTTNPVTGEAQSTLYWSALSQVPLLVNPSNLAGGWSGCVYARYLGDAYNDNDGDLNRGQITVGSGAGQRQWYGWEPMAVDDSQPRSGNWGDNSGNGNNNGPATTRWIGSTTWRTKNCNNAYFLDIGTSTNYDAADGSIVNGGGTPVRTSRPVAVPNPKAATGSNYTEWNTSGTAVTKKYSGAYRFMDPTKSYAEPGSVATYYNNPGSTDCTNCLTKGIIPLTPVKATIRDPISAIIATDPDGNTNIEQGLYWGWEVLMPGVPFNQAVVTTPFPRIQAIILMTDGEQVGGAGDAYKGRFGFQEGAGYNDDADHGTIVIKNPTTGANMTVQNNLNNRLRKLSDNVKAEGIKLYVIAFNLAGNTTALTLLSEIASKPDENPQYFFDAPNPSDLEDVFKQIAASLSTLHVSM